MLSKLAPAVLLSLFTAAAFAASPTNAAPAKTPAATAAAKPAQEAKGAPEKAPRTLKLGNWATEVEMNTEGMPASKQTLHIDNCITPKNNYAAALAFGASAYDNHCKSQDLESARGISSLTMTCTFPTTKVVANGEYSLVADKLDAKIAFVAEQSGKMTTTNVVMKAKYTGDTCVVPPAAKAPAAAAPAPTAVKSK